MKEYSGLRYKTYNNIKFKRDYSRVYFCSHNIDLKNCLEDISKEVWDIKKTITFWYKDFGVDYYENDIIKDEFFKDLEQMQLFIVPVTYEFLYTDNSARTIELPFAIKHNIPVLPILKETSLALEFNKKCGDLQALDKSTTDSTVISYQLKLKKFIESVLLRDGLIEKIKASFSGYIFLSYRKKDRKFVQDVMKAIHYNEFCRDIAIWYDEYLIPGEDFNETILKTLVKSQLFVLVVTPQILESPNYIMSIEYPMACKYNKQILPIMVQETEENIFQSCYENIPSTVNILEKDKIENTLIELLQEVIYKKNDEPDHLYYIGLAYLFGVDVETDCDRAICLLEQSAKELNMSALKKLVEIYRYGIGIKKDLKKAIEWQKKLVDIVLVAYKVKKSENICKWYISSLFELIELYEEQKEYGNVKKYIQWMCDFMEIEVVQFEDLNLHIWEINAYLKFCEISYEEGNINEYIYYFSKYLKYVNICIEKANAIDRKELEKEILLKEYELKFTKERYEDDNIDIQLAEIRLKQVKRKKEQIEKISYEIARYYFYYIENSIKIALIIEDKEEAKKMVWEGIEQIHILDDEKDTYIVANIFNLAGRVFENLENYQQAESYFQKSISICKNSTKQYDVEIIRILIENYNYLTAIYYKKNNIQKLYNIMKERLQVCLEFVKKTGSVNAMIKCIEAYEDFGKVERDAGHLEVAKEYFLAAYAIANRIYSTYREEWAINLISSTICLLEDIANLQKNTEEQIFYHNKAIKLYVEEAHMQVYLESRNGRNIVFDRIIFLAKELKTLADDSFLLDYLVEEYNRLGEGDDAKVNNLFVQFIQRMIKIAEGIDDQRGLLILMRLHKELANIYQLNEGEKSRQEQWIALQIGKKILQENFSERQAKEVLEITKSLSEEYLESNLETEWLKRIKVINYWIELEYIMKKHLSIGEMLENTLFQAALSEAAEEYCNSKKQYEFLTILISKLRIDEKEIMVCFDISGYYNFLTNLLVLKRCLDKNVSVFEIFGENARQYYKIEKKINIEIEQINYFSYLGMARTSCMLGNYEEGYQLYLATINNAVELDEEIIKSLKLSINVLMEHSKYEEALRICELAFQVISWKYESYDDGISCCDLGYFCGLKGELCIKIGNTKIALEYYQLAIRYNEQGIKQLECGDVSVNLEQINEFIATKLEELLKIYIKYEEILKQKGKLIKRCFSEKRIKEIKKQILKFKLENV